MKAVVQRVRKAHVAVDGRVTGAISFGLLVYLGVALGDSETDADWLANKISTLRIFDDAEGKMNFSLKEAMEALPPELKNGDAPAGVLAVSQFTLLADSRKGRRPYYGDAAAPEDAKRLYEYFKEKIKTSGLHCESGIFQASMMVSYTNMGPVTIILDTKQS